MLIHCLPLSNLSIFNVYRPAPPSRYSQPFSVFLDQFSSFLTHISTTPHEFVLTGDFNIHVNKHLDSEAMHFTSLLASYNLTQHINIPTHKDGNTLDLIITSAHSSLNPSISHSVTTTSDHFAILSQFNVSPNPPAPPTTFTYRKINSISIPSFTSDLLSSTLNTIQYKAKISIAALMRTTTPRRRFTKHNH